MQLNYVCTKDVGSQLGANYRLEVYNLRGRGNKVVNMYRRNL